MSSVPLYNASSSSLSESDLASLLSQIRSTSYIDEITSGETSRKESGLWDSVLLWPASHHLDTTTQPETGELSKDQIESILSHIDTTLRSSPPPKPDGDDNANLQPNVAWSTAAVAVADARTKKDGSLLIVQRGQGAKQIQATLRVAAKSLIEVVRVSLVHFEPFRQGELTTFVCMGTRDDRLAILMSPIWTWKNIETWQTELRCLIRDTSHRIYPETELWTSPL